MSFQQAPCRAETGNSVKALLNRKQTAKAINVSLRTIDEWREKGIIPFSRFEASFVSILMKLWPFFENVMRCAAKKGKGH